MNPDRLFPEIRRWRPSPPQQEFAEAVMRSIAGGRDPWRTSFRRILIRWWPAGILLAMLAAAWLVLTLPHGRHHSAPSTRTELLDSWP